MSRRFRKMVFIAALPFLSSATAICHEPPACSWQTVTTDNG
ncbi:MAG TPA: hypothetical protein VKQ05_09675 [Gemmatimonadales bacterium]|nr:hypothetical protein [Gemmatimonadales bacterium]